MDTNNQATNTLLTDLQTVIAQATAVLANPSLAEDRRSLLSQQRDAGQAHHRALQNGRPSAAGTAAAHRTLADITHTLTSLSSSARPSSVAPSRSVSAGRSEGEVLSSGVGATPHVLGKRKLSELVGQVDSLQRLDPSVEEILLEIADEFIESVSQMACRLAKHRRGDTLEVRDVQLHLERNWNIRIPGFAADEVRSLRRTGVVSLHSQRLKAIAEAKASRKGASD